MNHLSLTLTILNGAAALLGIYFVFRAREAYRKHGAEHLEHLGIAVGFLTAGLLAEGFLVRVVGWDIATAHVLEAGLGLIGFGFLVYSLYA